jgi:hypothetical protein
MQKPSDFFVGITEFFSVLMPGAAITFVLLAIGKERLGHDPGLSTFSGANVQYVAFFAVSYVLGHITDMIGAFFLDPLYDSTYVRWKTRESAADGPHSLESRAEEIARISKPRADRLHQWCRSWIVLKSPAAFTEIEELQAHSKFFRGMVTVAAITAALLLVPPFSAHSLILSGLCVAFAFGSFLRYGYLRWKAVQQSYRFFVLLHSEAGTTEATPAT